jgi:hypothetical protein
LPRRLGHPDIETKAGERENCCTQQNA